MDLIIKGIYSFSVYPVAELGTAFQNATVLALFDQETANQAGFDTVAQHALVYPRLPVGTPNDPSMYTYVKLRLPSGKIQILGRPWIVESSIEVVELGTITVKISNVSINDQAKIQQALAANGYSATQLTFS